MGSPNFFYKGLHDVIALVVHTAVGTLGSVDSTFQKQAPDPVSAHFCVGLDGTIHQYVDLVDGAWANGGPNPGWRWPFGNENPNYRTISVESEDNGQPDTEPVTDAQFDAITALYRSTIQPAWPGITHLVAHRVINPAHSCPAARWLNTGKFSELGRVLGLTVLT